MSADAQEKLVNAMRRLGLAEGANERNPSGWTHTKDFKMLCGAIGDLAEAVEALVPGLPVTTSSESSDTPPSSMVEALERICKRASEMGGHPWRTGERDPTMEEQPYVMAMAEIAHVAAMGLMHAPCDEEQPGAVDDTPSLVGSRLTDPYDKDMPGTRTVGWPLRLRFAGTPSGYTYMLEREMSDQAVYRHVVTDAKISVVRAGDNPDEYEIVEAL